MGSRETDGTHAVAGREGRQVARAAARVGQVRRPGRKGLGEQPHAASLGTETRAARDQKQACGTVRTSPRDRDAGRQEGRYSNRGDALPAT